MGDVVPPLRVLWQEGACLAIHKPAGWLVHRTGLDAAETRFVVQTLRDQLGQHVYPVHRLDKGTSGVLLMALSAEAARDLAGLFERRQVHKRYLAMVRGWPHAVLDVDHPLRPDDSPPDTPAQDARTRLLRVATWQIDEPIDRYPSTRVALVEAQPETGRRHQIRRHLKHIAHPIIGDATHGKGAHNRWWAQRLGGQRLWLHASELRWPHPTESREVVVRSDPTDAELNPDWRALLSQPWAWEEDAGSPPVPPVPAMPISLG